MSFLKSPWFHIAAAFTIGVLIAFSIATSGGKESDLKRDIKDRETKNAALERDLVNAEKIGATWYHKLNALKHDYSEHLREDSIAKQRYVKIKAGPDPVLSDREINRVLSELRQH